MPLLIIAFVRKGTWDGAVRKRSWGWHAAFHCIMIIKLCKRNIGNTRLWESSWIVRLMRSLKNKRCHLERRDMSVIAVKMRHPMRNVVLVSNASSNGPFGQIITTTIKAGTSST